MPSLLSIAGGAARCVAGLMLLFPLAACVPDGEAREPGAPLRVVATTGMVGDAVARVGGERVQVVTMMGPGIDPHLYKARAGDVRRVAEADIIFYNGLHLEAAMAELFEEMTGRTRTVAVTDGIERERLLTPPEFEGAYDPHVWFDVWLWMEVVRQIERALIEADSAGAQVYRDNAFAAVVELEALDDWVRRRVDELPPQRRVLITAHDAFNYFGRSFGFEVRGLQGISTVSEAGTGDVQRLVEFIVARRIPAIFVESSIPRRTVEAVQAAVRARGYQVRIGGSLFSDAMGDAGTYEGTYVGMVMHNVNTIVDALLDESVASGTPERRR